MPVQYPTGHHRRAPRHAQRAPASSTSRTWAASCCAAPAPRASSSTCSRNNAEALDPLQAQYTIVPTPTGGAVDDAYLYRFEEDEYLLVVNAANRVKDWEHFQEHLRGLPRRRAHRRDRRDRHAGPAGPGVPGHPRRAHRDRRRCPSRSATSCSIATLQRARAGRRRGSPSCRYASPAPATPASRSASSCSWPPRTGRHSGTRWSQAAPRPSGSAPATRCASRPACRCTGTSSASTPRATRSPS